MNPPPPLPVPAVALAMRGCGSREVITVVLPHIPATRKVKALLKRNWR